MTTSIRVSGNILSELSEKIPTIIIALNELMKNSYDAGASFVNISIDSKNKELVITDNGSGMDLEDISTLFHISESKKEYGTINEYGRITQGSKGLGFLSVFKFGAKVTWKTRKSTGLQFDVDFDDIIACQDISNYNIDVIEDDAIDKGTKIIVSMSDYSSKTLQTYLSDEKNIRKILYSFEDDKFAVEIDNDGTIVKNSGKRKTDDILPERKLYNVVYDSKDAKLEFYINGCLAISKDYPLNDDRYTISIDLTIFSLVQYDKRKIDSLFYNPQDELTPLVYVNTNLFNNYTIFDPSIMRHKKSSLVLGQMIGYISIISSNPLLNFNSDRTQFLQNELTDNIIAFLETINMNIQDTGALHKEHVLNFDILKANRLPHSFATANDAELRSNIVHTFAFRDQVKISVEKNYVTYKLFNREATAIIQEKAAAVPAKVNLKKHAINIPIISNQIQLECFIVSGFNSKGDVIAKSDIDIYVNNILSESRVLESIAEECQVPLRFEYDDAVTGKAIEEMTLTFFQPAAEVTVTTTKDKLLMIPAMDSYAVSFNYSIQRLILQLNELNIAEYLEVIACSLRALFDISTDCIGRTTHYSGFFEGHKGSLEDKVKHTIEYFKSDNSKITKLAHNTGIDYNSLRNRLIPDDYYNAIKKAHMGAHKSTLHITEPEIRELAHKASLFVVIANEMIANSI